jgi:rubrerythrin
MKKSDVLQLWDARFRRVLKNEVSAREAYKDFLKRYDHILRGSRIKPMLRAIAKDEDKHADIAKRLIQIVRQKSKKA